MTKELKRKKDLKKKRRPDMVHGVKRHEKQVNVVTEVQCRLCGDVLASLVELNEPVEVAKKGNTIIQRVPVALVPTPNYATLVIEMDDGSFHETTVSKRRLGKPFTVEELEDIYTDDLEEWEAEGMDPIVLGRYADKTPVGVAP